MTLRLLSVAICCALMGAGGVSAQAIVDGETIGLPQVIEAPSEPDVVDEPALIAGVDFDEWSAFAIQAEGIVEPGTASSFALSRVRAKLVPWRDIFTKAQGINSARLATIDRQIAALSPTDETADPNPLIVSRLDALKSERTRLARPNLLAQEAYARADGLIGEIDSQDRALETVRLMARGASPANPTYWPTAMAALGVSLTDALSETYANAVVFKNDGRWFSRLGTVLGSLIAVIFFVFWVRSRLSRLARKDIGSTPRVHSVARFLLTVARVILPVVGLTVLTGILASSGLFGLIGLEVVAVLPAAGALIFITKWLADHYFPKHPDNDGLLGYDVQTRRLGRKFAVLLGWTLALSILVDALISSSRATAVTLDVINLPFQLLTGWLLWRLGAQVAQSASPDSQTIFKRNRIRKFIGRGAQAFAVAGPLASLLGFGAAAQSITIPAVVSLAIVATIAVLHRLSFEVMSHSDVIVDADSPTTEISDTRGSGLWPVVVNFVVVMISLPVFALVWGMSTSELAEIWTRFLAGFSVGGATISPTSFLTFATVFAVGYVITGFIKTSLKMSVLPRTQLDLGGQNAIVAGTGYVGIFLAALIAFSVAGIDLSSLAIVAGALSVGIGFGLQNIVSNFVSGIILLIERPIGEGDMIEVGGQMGYVRDISVRSTRIETFDRTDVIVPNADLVSGQVTNWTRGSLVGRTIVAVGVGYSSDTKRVVEILQEIAEANPIVVLNPPPSVLLMNIGADSFNFEIRAIIRDVNFVNVAKSEMYLEIIRRFADEGIEMPYQQRDLWLRNPEMLRPQGDPA